VEVSRLAIVTSVIAGACSYQPGSFRDRRGEFRGPRAVVGCLDVAIDAVEDGAAVGQPVELAFGNHCDVAVDVDFAALRPVGRDAHGQEVALVAFDPRHELHRWRIDGRQVGREVIELQVEGSSEPPSLVCLDVGGLDPEAHRSQVLCVDGRDEVMP
jgi:hypothetical protein